MHRIYLAPKPGFGTHNHWGGWHITLASRAAYAGNIQHLAKSFEDVLKWAVGSHAWHLTHANSTLDTSFSPARILILSDALNHRLIPGLINAGSNAKQTAKPGSLHMVLDSPPSGASAAYDEMIQQKTPFYIWVVEVDDTIRGSGDWLSSKGVYSRPSSRPNSRVTPMPRQLSGAGVLLVEMYNRRGSRSTYGNSKRGAAVILFREQSTQMYSDLGGGIDAGEQPFECAQREAAEESLGLFRIDLKNARISGKVVLPKDAYLSFVVPVVGPAHEGIRRDRYEQNLKHLRDFSREGGVVPHAWLETDAMTRFFVDDLMIAGVLTRRGDLTNVPDVYGETCTIAGRAKAVVREAINQGCLGNTVDDANTLQSAGRCGDAFALSRSSLGHKMHCYWLEEHNPPRRRRSSM